VISTDVPSGVSWVNQHERTGLVVPAGNVERLRSAIVRLMMDDGLRARFGEAGRVRVDREFTHVRFRERLASLYAELSLLEPSFDAARVSAAGHLSGVGHLADVERLVRGASPLDEQTSRTKHQQAC